MSPRIAIDHRALAKLCERWQITEVALYGSVVRDDFGPESDVDVLVSFKEEAHPTLFDLAAIREDLMEIFGREVDIATRRSVEQSRNPHRREAILHDAEVIHGG